MEASEVRRYRRRVRGIKSTATGSTATPPIAPQVNGSAVPDQLLDRLSPGQLSCTSMCATTGSRTTAAVGFDDVSGFVLELVRNMCEGLGRGIAVALRPDAGPVSANMNVASSLHAEIGPSVRSPVPPVMFNLGLPGFPQPPKSPELTAVSPPPPVFPRRPKRRSRCSDLLRECASGIRSEFGGPPEKETRQKLVRQFDVLLRGPRKYRGPSEETLRAAQLRREGKAWNEIYSEILPNRSHRWQPKEAEERLRRNVKKYLKKQRIPKESFRTGPQHAHE
jgi:hypothetical protein